MTAPPLGFVVAGGRSLRMGRDKALLPWGATTLLDHALARLRALCPEVRVLSGAHARYSGRGLCELLDAWHDAGPLGGVLAGLESLGQARDGDLPAGLFLAVDVPHVRVELLAYLLEVSAGWDAVVPVTAAGPEPLCALYRASCREPIRRRLAAGERRMDSFYPDVRLRRVDDRELRAFGDPALLFTNVNTPADYERLRER